MEPTNNSIEQVKQQGIAEAAAVALDVAGAAIETAFTTAADIA